MKSFYIKYFLNKDNRTRLTAFIFLSLIVLFPSSASAGFLDKIESLFITEIKASEVKISEANSQNLPLLEANSFYGTGVGGVDSTIIVGESVIEATSGPAGTGADFAFNESISNHGRIVTYTVKKGDSLGVISEMFDVSVSTILWANNLSRNSVIKQGQELIILPVSGVRHIVKKGENLSSIVKKYKGDMDDVISFNDLTTSSVLSVGDEIIIPNVEISEPVLTKTSSSSGTAYGTNAPSYVGYYARPVSGGTKTQGLHGYNAIDIGAPIGTPILAAAKGTVLIAIEGGWNRGYGSYVVVGHQNGTQTLYAHASKVLVKSGQVVDQGDVLALMGSTGKSTGSHLHFEIRGAKNPF